MARTGAAPAAARDDDGGRPLLWHRGRTLVRLLDEQPELAAGLDPAAAEAARRGIVARTLWLDPGSWVPAPADDERCRDWLGVLVLDGMISRMVALERLTAQELVGPGDLLRPWEDAVDTASVPSTRAWCVLERARVAILDDRVAATACRWPPVMTALVSRTLERARAVAVHLAIAQARQADLRLLLLFWHLADRWGRVGREGTIVPVPLTHERIAELVCLRRPTVSTALRRLAGEGVLCRRPDGTWLLSQPPPDPAQIRRRPRGARSSRPADIATG